MIKQAAIFLVQTIPNISSVCIVYGDVKPQLPLVFPYCVVTMITDTGVRDLSGVGNQSQAKFAVAFYSLVNNDTSTLAQVLFTTYRKGYKGTVLGFTIDWVSIDNESETYVNPDQGDEKGVHITTCDMTIVYER